MNKTNKSINLLIIEDNLGDCILLKKTINRTGLSVTEIRCAETLGKVPEILEGHSFDLVFLDLTLPDSKGISSFITLNKQIPDVPIIILTGLSDMELALRAINLGAQDYILKEDLNDKVLAKSMQYSMERKKILGELMESNNRYMMANKATNDIIWEWDYKTNSGIWGEGLIKYLGYTTEHLMKNENWASQYLHPDDKNKVMELVAYYLDHKLENWQTEFRFKAADGSYRNILDRGYIIYHKDGKPKKMFGAMSDITERLKLEQALTEQKIFQQKLITETTIDAQENERNMLGRELHDNINQILTTAKMYIHLAQTRKENIETFMADSFKLLETAIEEIRMLSKTLVAPSLGDLGLHVALQELVEEINFFKKVKVRLIYRNSLNKELEKKTALMLFRIVQEQMNNIRKYAKAKNAVITLKVDMKQITLSVLDDGIGFNTGSKANGIGLRNIKNRVEFYSGLMNIVSSPGNGCKIEVSIPFKNEYIEKDNLAYC